MAVLRLLYEETTTMFIFHLSALCVYICICNYNSLASSLNQSCLSHVTMGGSLLIMLSVFLCFASLGGKNSLSLFLVQCFPAPNIICKDYIGNETHFTGNEVGFFKPISCRNV